MKLLLDTHVLLWVAGDSPRLSTAARRLVTAPANELLFSAASIWEIAIKHALGKHSFEAEPGVLRHGLLENGYTELVVTGAHAAAVAHLPEIHKDPFDRLLVAQSLVEGITLLTVDKEVARYPGAIRKI